MPRSGPLLTEQQWKKIEPLFPRLPKNPRGGRPWIENRRVVEGILWILRSGAPWKYLPKEYPHPSTCWRRLRDWEEQCVWLDIWRTFLGELNERQQLKWSESFLDGSFAPAKKGRWGRQNQAGQGDEVDGGGRRRGSSSGKPPSRCIHGGSPTRRGDARGDPSPDAGPAAAKAGAGDRRQGLRQRSVAGAVGTPPHRTDRAAPPEPPQTADAGWSCAAPLPASLDCRAHLRLDRQLSPTDGALGSFPHHLQCVFPYRLLHDRLTEGCAIASSKGKLLLLKPTRYRPPAQCSPHLDYLLIGVGSRIPGVGRQPIDPA